MADDAATITTLSAASVGGLSTNLDAFTDVQWLTMRSKIAPYPF